MSGYRVGLSAPLPLFEQAGYAYMERKWALLHGSRAVAGPLDYARWTWRTASFRRGDDADPYVALCFRGRDPFEEAGEAFVEWADVLWEPIFRRRGART